MKYLSLLCLLFMMTSCSWFDSEDVKKEPIDEDQRNEEYLRQRNDALAAARSRQGNSVQDTPNLYLGTKPKFLIEAEKMKSLKIKARKGNKDSQYSLGLCYKYGIGVKPDNETAAFWFEKAANQGHLQAKRVLFSLLNSK
ncbi:MAG: hypothetical protein NE334_04880 [Lentisphaeraceae bacterium]|nr:hypothetical protein [Lentisphaeraceae bacterium]